MANPCAGKQERTPWPLRVIRLVTLAGMVAVITLTTAFVLPFCGTTHRARWLSRWGRAFLWILNMRLEVVTADSRQHAEQLTGSLILANHISWLDIAVISAAVPTQFISKAEVRRWPLIGWLCAQHHTLFLHRGTRSHLRQIGKQIIEHLQVGLNIAMFPEGTTTVGDRVLHFHTALMQSAIDARQALQPVALSYWEPFPRTAEGGGSDTLCRSVAPAYVEDISLMQSVYNLLNTREMVARVCWLPQLRSEDFAHRREVGEAARLAIVGAIDSRPQSTSISSIKNEAACKAACVAAIYRNKP